MPPASVAQQSTVQCTRAPAVAGQRGSPHVRFAGGGNLNSAVLELTVVITVQYDTRRYFNVRSKADIVSLMYHTEPN